jgi:hypothetical protein
VPPELRCALRGSVRVACGAWLLVAAVGCVRKVTRYYVPSPGNPQFTIDEAGGALLPFVQVHCGEGDRKARGEKGDAKLEVLVGSDGHVTRAEVKDGTGNNAIDGLFGTFGAQLSFPPPSHQRELTRNVRMRYVCGNVVESTVQVEG